MFRKFTRSYLGSSCPQCRTHRNIHADNEDLLTVFESDPEWVRPLFLFFFSPSVQTSKDLVSSTDSVCRTQQMLSAYNQRLNHQGYTGNSCLWDWIQLKGLRLRDLNTESRRRLINAEAPGCLPQIRQDFVTAQ